MKVILTQELKGRGGEGDVVEVARGFAVNFLLPRKLAIEATPGNIKQLEQRMHNIKQRETQRIGDAGSLASALEGKKVTIAAKVGEEGRLFGSVTTPMIHEAILDQLGVDIDKRRIETHRPIKDVGPHVVDVSIYREVRAQLTVEVVAESAGAEEKTAVKAPATPLEETPETPELEDEEFGDEASTVDVAEEDVAVENAEDE